MVRCKEQYLYFLLCSKTVGKSTQSGIRFRSFQGCLRSRLLATIWFVSVRFGSVGLELRGLDRTEPLNFEMARPEWNRKILECAKKRTRTELPVRFESVKKSYFSRFVKRNHEHGYEHRQQYRNEAREARSAKSEHFFIGFPREKKPLYNVSCMRACRLNILS